MDMMRKQAKMAALKEILSMLGDMEAEPFMPKPEVKAVKVGILAKKPMGMEGEMEGESMEEKSMEGEGKEEENGLELEAKGANLEELKKKLAELLK